MNKIKVLLIMFGIVFLVWALGILTRLWANPIFSYFWVASNNMADNLSFVGLGVGAFLVGLALIVYRRNTKSRTANSHRLFSIKQLEVKSTSLLGIGGIILLVWSIGILTRLWANPIFGIFMVASNNVADILSYIGLGVGAFLLGSALTAYRRNSKSETDKFVGSYTHRQLKVKSHDEHLQKKTNERIDNEDDSNQLVIVNGRQSDLGSEAMERIVDE